MLKPDNFNVDDDHCSQQILGEQAEILAQQVRLRTEELETVIAEFKSTQQQMDTRHLHHQISKQV